MQADDDGDIFSLYPVGPRIPGTNEVVLGVIAHPATVSAIVPATLPAIFPPKDAGQEHYQITHCG